MVARDSDGPSRSSRFKTVEIHPAASEVAASPPIYLKPALIEPKRI